MSDNQETDEYQPLREMDWNFEKVPDPELAACCYWEYARESSFICGVRQRCLDPKWKQMVNSQLWEYCGHDLEKIQSIGYQSEVFLRGFFFEPDMVWQSADPDKPNYRHPDVTPITGSFPAAWQSLDSEERRFRGQIRCVVDQLGIVPIKISDWPWAKDIARKCQNAADEQHEQWRAWQEKNQREDPKQRVGLVAETPAAPEFEPIEPGISWGGRETLMVDIAWDYFTNDELVAGFRQWVKAARPEHQPTPNDKGRNKARDRRVALERLGMLRLLHHFSLREVPSKCPQAWFLYGKREWYKERKRAGEFFHRLLPFLSTSERPLNWPTKGGRGR